VKRLKLLSAVIGLLLISGVGMAQINPRASCRSVCSTIGDVRIHYLHYLPSDTLVVRGSVLLVHGFAGSTFSWRFITDTLVASGFEVVAVDVPPYGYSDKNPALNQSFTARALLLMDFLAKELPERRWHLTGHSMGGGMVEALAILMQDQVLSVTFVDGAIFRSLHVGPYPVPMLFRNPVSRGILLTVFKPLMVNRPAVKWMLKSAYGTKPSRRDVTGYLRPLQERGTARAILRSAAASVEVMPVAADSLKVPVLAFWGSNDRWIPEEVFAPVLELMPDTRKVIIEGAAHCPMETHPEEFIRVFLPFLLVNTPSDQ